MSADLLNPHTRRYPVTHWQMLQFREALSDQKNIRLHGTAERGEIAISLPFGFGEVLLSYQHGEGQLEVTLVASPKAVDEEIIWKNITQKIEQAQLACPREI